MLVICGKGLWNKASLAIQGSASENAQTKTKHTRNLMQKSKLSVLLFLKTRVVVVVVVVVVVTIMYRSTEHSFVQAIKTKGYCGS